MREFFVQNKKIFPNEKNFQQDTCLKVRVKTKSGIQIVSLSELHYVEAYAPYTYIHLSDGSKLFCGEAIRYFETKLADVGFLRIHKSILVNVGAIVSYKKEGSGSVLLVSGVELNLARGKKQLLLEMLEEQYL